MKITDRPSPNFGDRIGEAAPSLIVLHYTAMPSCDEALERLCSEESGVSSHYLVGADGSVFRMVAEDKRAWHAGDGRWAGRGDVNSRSIGIELDNDGASEFAEPLMTALEALLGAIIDRYDLPPKSVIGHSDFAPDRKCDPGRMFDWQRLAEKGLSIWPEPSLDDDFMRHAAVFGYPVEHGEAVVLDAFRQRFRPTASGPMSPADRALMAGLARQFQADVTARFNRRVPSRPLSSLR
ncbi:MAG: N-acetylmuramoyl-L-alanine amidase [Boseongicola sp.]|nr:N-acetylmuramoyl-L-alanine amidase [Boseongicola sp.]